MDKAPSCGRLIPETKESDVGFLEEGRAYAFAYEDCLGPRDEEIVQSEEVFWGGVCTHLIDCGNNRDVAIAEMGWGAGFNLMATWTGWEKARAAKGELGLLRYVSYEVAPMSVPLLSRIHRQVLAKVGDKDKRKDYEKKAAIIRSLPFARLGIRRYVLSDSVILYLVFGDVRESLQLVSHQFDAWYLSGFAPRCNPEMYGREVVNNIKKKSNHGARIVSYSVASSVVKSLTSIGCTVAKIPTTALQKKQSLQAEFLSHRVVPDRALRDPADGVVVIGGGIAGLLCRHAFEKAGIKVLLIDNPQENAPSRIPSAMVTPGIPDLTQQTGCLRLLCFDYAVNFYKQYARSAVLSEGSLHILDGFRLRQVEKRGHEKILQDAGMRLLNHALVTSLAQIPMASDAVHWRNSLHLDTKKIRRCLEEGSHALRCEVTRVMAEKTHWNIFSQNELLVKTKHVIFALGSSLVSFQNKVDPPLEMKRSFIHQEALLFLMANNAITKNLQQSLMGSVYMTPSWQNEQGYLHHTVGARSQRYSDGGETAYKILSKRLHAGLLAMYGYTEKDIKIDHIFRSTKLMMKDRLPICGNVYNDGAKTSWILGALGGHGYTLAPLLAEVLLESFLGGVLPLNCVTKQSIGAIP